MDSLRGLQELGPVAVVRAEALMDQAARERTGRERRGRARLARLVDDPDSLGLVISLTDDVVRTRSARAAAQSLTEALSRGGRRGFSLLDWWGLRGLEQLARVAPRLVQRLVLWRLRSLTREVIGSTESRQLRALVETRRKEQIRLNVNVLGEAVLGPDEADRRLVRVLEMMTRPYVDYVSVKLSAVVAHLDYYDRVGSTTRLAEALRRILDVALEHSVFVNVDMEEFRDLRVTVEAFGAVILEPRYLGLSVGVVVQAYLPESREVLDYLAERAHARSSLGGAPLKVRLVKGANLAMERVEARLTGAHPPTYRTKADVDASYLDLVGRALSRGPELRVGVASHNLYHVAFALEAAAHLGALERLDLEMLEGMAPAEARLLARHSTCPVITYAPVTDLGDFAAAIAYLVRRLDENTSPDNYLTAAFFVDPGTARSAPTRTAQRERFLKSLADTSALSRERLRTPLEPPVDAFANTPDGDVTDPVFVDHLRRCTDALDLARVADTLLEPGDTPGVDPSTGRVAYHYRRPSPDEVERILGTLREAQPGWAERRHVERSALLLEFARLADRERAETMALMAHDTGKTPGESNAEVSEAADFAREYATHDDGSRALGVVTVAPPW
ncbi:MAG: bifunctional proline dehydrogenase/L-glutamate gamma-semialdehyde dehydrogenase, partial [Acidimicrobiaceae bacterium]|nr:bifunctional proline dehydrogenase/L-glutamate gamma-semialdehyde dehydrogenase [Acidimicrobiaceae bacterium]